MPRIAAGLLGGGLVSLSIIGLLLDREAQPTTGYSIAGALILLAAFLGTVPDLRWGDRGLIWPPLEVLDRIETAEASAAEMVAETQRLRAEVAENRRLLEDYILAHEPVPDDDLDDDQERIRVLEQDVADLDHEHLSLMFHGEADKEGVAGMLDRAREALHREERRQAARKRIASKGFPLS